MNISRKEYFTVIILTYKSLKILDRSFVGMRRIYTYIYLVFTSSRRAHLLKYFRSRTLHSNVCTYTHRRIRSREDKLEIWDFEAKRIRYADLPETNRKRRYVTTCIFHIRWRASNSTRWKDSYIYIYVYRLPPFKKSYPGETFSIRQDDGKRKTLFRPQQREGLRATADVIRLTCAARRSRRVVVGRKLRNIFAGTVTRCNNGKRWGGKRDG